MIDSHTHLGLCDRPPAELVADARAAGVVRLLSVGLDAASSRAELRRAEALEGVRVAVGHHPNAAGSFDAAAHDELEALAAHPCCAAIGETGLDFYREGAPRADQERAFRAQIELARRADRPLVIHSRAADDATLALLEAEAGGLAVVLHCFSMPDRVEACVARGWWISFAGNVTYPRARELRHAAAQVPADRLLVETDAPYLTPQARRGQRNEPGWVVHTAQVVADARGVELAQLDAEVSATAAKLFGW